MAVYTQLSHAEISDFLADYEVGELVDFKGIAEGVSNTNYLLTTSNQQLTTKYILTIFEKNFNENELPFFMDLTEYLADYGIPCPRPIHSRTGTIIGKIKNKPAVLVEFLQGAGNPEISEKHLELLGEMVAKFHLATKDFKQERANSLSLSGVQKLFEKSRERVPEIEENLENEIAGELEFLAKNLPQNLPKGIIHADIFPDNVFFSTNPLQVTGIIDFYFSCTDFFAYELAIILNAWCFDTQHKFVPARADALINSYNKIRLLNDAEKNALPILTRVASMRFLVTRADAWLNRSEGALVNVKDPMEYVEKLRFWQNYEWQI